MKHLLTIKQSDIEPGHEDSDNSNFQLRVAARAVVLDSNGRVALLKSAKHNYHKLPGGGVDDGEEIHEALHRELLEEIGCEAEVTSELGVITEYRDKWELKQVSYCFVARLVGEIGTPNFTEKEIAEGFETIWAQDLDTAIKLLENDAPTHYDGIYMNRRDLTFLKAVKN